MKYLCPSTAKYKSTFLPLVPEIPLEPLVPLVPVVPEVPIVPLVSAVTSPSTATKIPLSFLNWNSPEIIDCIATNYIFILLFQIAYFI